MKYYIIAGEASGDLHASNLMKEMKKQDAAAQFRCWGGDLMKAEGADLVKHYRDLAFMGFTEVLMNLRTILKNISLCKKDIEDYQPDAVILVDYPGFNLRIAEFSKQAGFKVFYYISPQVWAWKKSRVHTIKRCVDRMFVILPFEKDFYKDMGMEVDFVGHPLIDAIEQMKPVPLECEVKEGERIVALLPGSRRQEISVMLPVMLEMQKEFTDCKFIIAGAPSIPADFYTSLLGNSKAQIVYGQTYALLQKADAALVTSGTATLETGLFGVPEVVCYKGGAISFAIAKRLVDVKYISLVNLIMDREVVKELIQADFNSANLNKELAKILNDGPAREKMKSELAELKKKLGGRGASENTAKLIVQHLGKA